MKKAFLVFLTLILLLSACGESDNVYTVEQGNTVFTVDTENCTISYGSTAVITVSYILSGNDIRFVYPDGSYYWWTQSGSMGHGGWSDDYYDNGYVRGDVLLDVLSAEMPDGDSGSSAGAVLVAIILIPLGVWSIVSPYSVWYLSYGWRFKDVEPSDAALGMERFGGVAAVIIALVLLLTAVFG